MKASKEQIKQLYAILNRLSMTEDKDSIVYDATGGRTTSVREMEMREAKLLIDELNRKANNSKEEQEKMRMKRKIFLMCRQMDWRTDEGDTDYKRIDAYCIKYGSAKKSIWKCNKEELRVLIYQLTKTFEHYLKSI
jgi:polyhydroxyalkanoate synthesis regulator phasin